MMKSEIITIGDELLIGQTIDTNSAWMGRELNKAGFYVSRIVSVSDNEAEILQALEDAGNRARIVIMTGGLGPTKDDITKSTLCKFFNTHLEVRPDVLERVEGFFASVNRPLLESNRRQAELPVSCTVLPNLKGTASGMWFDKDGVIYISLPGVPYEMTHLMETQVIPALVARFEPTAIVHKTIMTQGAGESMLAEIIKDWEEELAENNLKLAYLPSPGIVKLRISSYGGNHSRQQAAVDRAVKALYKLIPQYIYSEDEKGVEEVVGELLKKHKATLALAESCTGGFVSHLITSIPGCSEYYKGGITAYASEIKEELLQVPAELIRTHGAVSREVVERMAQNARIVMKSDYALATSGIAGPTGETDDKQIGTVCFAVATPTRVVSDMQIFGKDRLRVIERSTQMVLNLLRKELLKDFGV